MLFKICIVIAIFTLAAILYDFFRARMKGEERFDQDHAFDSDDTDIEPGLYAASQRVTLAHISAAKRMVIEKKNNFLATKPEPETASQAPSAVGVLVAGAGLGGLAAVTMAPSQRTERRYEEPEYETSMEQDVTLENVIVDEYRCERYVAEECERLVSGDSSISIGDSGSDTQNGE